MIVSRNGGEGGNYEMVLMGGGPGADDFDPTEPSGDPPDPQADDTLSVDTIRDPCSCIPRDPCGCINFYPYNQPVYVCIVLMSLAIALIVFGTNHHNQLAVRLGVMCLLLCGVIFGIVFCGPLYRCICSRDNRP